MRCETIKTSDISSSMVKTIFMFAVLAGPGSRASVSRTQLKPADLLAAL